MSCSIFRVVAAVAALSFTVACGDDTDSVPNTGDTTTTGDESPGGDGDTGDPGGDGDDAPPPNPNCPDPTAALPTTYRPINEVAATEITALTEGTIEVDATAGGFMEFADNPFIYISFADGTPTKVDITDTAAYASKDWDIALKRTVIRANGGDSGPGAVEVASVSAGDLGSATAPSDSSYATDDFATEDCELVAGQIGEPLTSFDGWYIYDSGTRTVTPADLVWFVRTPERHMKLRILDYYRGDVSATYEIEWAEVAE